MVTRKPPAKKAAAKKAPARKTTTPAKKTAARKTTPAPAATKKAPTSRGGLRAVGEEDAAAAVEAAAKKPMTVSAAFATGSRRDQLVALGAVIAETVGNRNTPPRDLAALSRRLLEIGREIEAIDAADDEDDITAAAGTPDAQFEPEAL